MRIPNPADSAGTHELPCDCPCFPSSITKHLEGGTTCGACVASNRAERDSSPKATRRVERMRQQFIRRTHVWPRRGPAEVRGHFCSKLNNLSLAEVPRIIPNRSVADASYISSLRLRGANLESHRFFRRFFFTLPSRAPTQLQSGQTRWFCRSRRVLTTLERSGQVRGGGGD